MTRIIPARELTISEIKQIRNTTDIEIEVFVHGDSVIVILGSVFLAVCLAQGAAIEEGVHSHVDCLILLIIKVINHKVIF